MTTTPYAERGKRIHNALLASGMSQIALAERLGIGKQSINDIISGRTPGEKHLAAIAQLLDVPEEWIRQGGPLPDALRGVNDAGLPIDQDVGVYLEVVREAARDWANLRERDAKAFESLVQQVPGPLARDVRLSGSRPWRVRDLDSILAAVRLIGLEPAPIHAFTSGHRILAAHVQRAEEDLGRQRPHENPADRSLPLEIFKTVRGALLVLRTERSAFDRSARDVERALTELWERQLGVAWPGDAGRHLRSLREQDLGPDLNQPIDQAR